MGVVGQLAPAVLAVAGSVRHRVDGREPLCAMAGGALRHRAALERDCVFYSRARAARRARQCTARNSTWFGLQRQDLDGDLRGSNSTGLCLAVARLRNLYLCGSDVVDS